MTRAIKSFTITWQGIVIDIHYESRWMGRTTSFSSAHLVVQARAPEQAPLPITETGYRSHFTSAATIEEAGGPVAFVLAWLEREGQSPTWKMREEASRQMSLF